MAKKTVVFLSLAYSPSIGGAEKQAQLLAESWAAAGQPVLVLTRRLPHAPHEEILNGVRVIRIPSLWLPGLAWISFTGAALVTLAPMVPRISCLIGVMLNPGTFPGAILARLSGIPLILRPSAGGPGGNIQTLARSRWGSIKLSFLLGSAAYVVAMNHEVADEVAAAGIPAGKIRIIPNGADVERFAPASGSLRAERRRDLGLKEEDLVAIFVGRLEKVKNVDGLLRAWKKVGAEIPTARLLIIGDGSERSSLGSFIQEQGLSSSVRIEGLKSHLVPYYQAADLFILPSHREGISNAFLEAMASGLAPVASRVGGNREILSEFSPDLLIDPDAPDDWSSVLVPLLRNRERREDIGRRARTFVEERFSAGSMKRQYEELLSNVSRPSFGRFFPILAYHRIVPTPVFGVDTSVKEFSEQLAWLASAGYRSISLEELYASWREGRSWPSKAVVLTFDDGHREFYEHALPVLKRHAFTATLFVNTGFLGKKFWVEGRRPAPVMWHDAFPPHYDASSPSWRTYEFMTWEQIGELHRSGFEIGSHAVTHPFLTDLSSTDLKQELEESKRMLEGKLGTPAKFFCYPSGDFDLRVQKAVHQAAYLGAVHSPSHDRMTCYWDNAMAWERIGVWKDTPLWKFKSLVSGRYTSIRRRCPSWVWKGSRVLFRLLGRPLGLTAAPW